MILLGILIGVLLWLPSSLQAAAIPHAFATQFTEQSQTSATYGDISGAAITSGSFTTGKKHLICASAAVAEDGAGLVGIRMVHGSTAFAESESLSSRSSTTKEYYAYRWCTVWTAVSNEGIKLQLSSSNGTSNAFAHFITLWAIQLEDYLTENTDWFFAERSNDDALSAVATDGASITFTPGTASQDWLVMSWSQIDSTSGTTAHQSRIVRSGEASSSNPQADFQPLLTTAQYGISLSRVFNLGTSSNTFKEQSQAGATFHTRLHSSIFAINLHKFAQHTNTYTDSSTTLSSSEYGTQVETISITPAVLGDVLVGGFVIGDKTASAAEVELRLQDGNSDIITGMTAASLNYDNTDTTVTTNDIPVSIQTMYSASAAAHTIDMDGSADSSNAMDVKQRSLWAFTMELAATAGSGSSRMMLLGVGNR